MEWNKIGFIGCGNMGGALAQAAAKKSHALCFANPTRSKAERLCQQLGGEVCSNEAAAEQCGLIFLGVKPQKLRKVMEEMRPVLDARQDRFVLVSMAAGWTLAELQALAGEETPIIRIMPNTPVSVGEGIILYCTAHVREEEEQAFISLMEGAGALESIDESLMDVGGTLSGCGPAFADLFLEALADGAVACGLPRDQALRYAAQMLLGSAKLALDSGDHPGVLKDGVCSPGGSTIQGVRTLEKGGLRSAVMEAVIAAFQKNQSLGG